jgi:hypothetical protein
MVVEKQKTIDKERKEKEEDYCNDPEKRASQICAITPKGLVNLKLS